MPGSRNCDGQNGDAEKGRDQPLERKGGKERSKKLKTGRVVDGGSNTPIRRGTKQSKPRNLGSRKNKEMKCGRASTGGRKGGMLRL